MGNPWEKYKTTQTVPVKPWEKFGGSTEPPTPVDEGTPGEPMTSTHPQTAITDIGKQPIVQPTVASNFVEKRPVEKPETKQVSPVAEGRAYVGVTKPNNFIVTDAGELETPKPEVTTVAVTTPVRVATMPEVITAEAKKQAEGKTYEQIQKDAENKREELGTRNLDASTALYEVAFEKNPNDPYNPLQIGYNDALQGNWDDALTHVNTSIGLYDQQPSKPGVTDKGNPYAYQLRSYIDYNKGDYQQAITDADRAIMLQGYKREDAPMYAKDENDYYNIAQSARYAKDASMQLNDQAGVERYQKIQDKAAQMGNNIIGAKSYKQTVEYIASGQLGDDLVSYIPFFRQMQPLVEQAGAGMKDIEKGKDDQQIMKGVNEIIGSVFTGMQMATPGLEVPAYFSDKVLPEEYTSWVMKPVSLIAGKVFGQNTENEYYKFGDVAGSLVLMAIMQHGMESKMEKVSDYTKVHGDAELAKKLYQMQPLTQKEGVELKKIIDNSTPETLKKAIELNDKIKGNDSKNLTGVSGEIREGEKPVEAKPVVEGGKEKAGHDRVVQTEEEVALDQIESDLRQRIADEKLKVDEETIGDAAALIQEGVKPEEVFRVIGEAKNDAELKTELDRIESEHAKFSDEQDVPENIKPQLDEKAYGKKITPEEEAKIPKVEIDAPAGVELPEGVTLHEVDGTYLRDNVNVDFTSGTNGYAHPNYVPKNEVWIDKSLPEADKTATIKHELRERELMKDGKTYNEAHEIAAKEEAEFRQGKQLEIPFEEKKVEVETPKAKVTAEKVEPVGELKEVEDAETLGLLEKYGEPGLSTFDLEKRLADGDRVFMFDEATETPFEITKTEQLNLDTPDRYVVIPKGVEASKAEMKVTTERIETKEPPTKEPPKAEGEAPPPGEIIKPTEIKHEKTEELRKEQGLEERPQREEKTDQQLNAEADELIKKGFDLDTLADEIINNKRTPTDVEQVMLGKKIALLNDALKKIDPKSPEFDKTFEQLERTVTASDMGGSELGAALGMRARFKTIPEDSLAEYLLKEKELNKDAPLTDEQKSRVVKEYEEISKVKDELEEKLRKSEEENARLRAEKEFRTTVKYTQRKAAKYERTESRTERVKKLDTEFEDLSKKLSLAARGQLHAGINPELISIVGEMVKNRVEKGTTKLSEVVDEIYQKAADYLTKKQIHDIIAGEYSEKKTTRNDVAKQIVDLKSEARAINKLEELNRGVEPKSEKAKIRRNQELAELRKQIKEHDLTKLSEYKRKVTANIEKLQFDLDTGKYKPEPKRPQVKLDPEAKALKDRYIKLKNEREARLIKQEYQNRTRYEKVRDAILEVLNIPRTLMSSGDFSGVLRQAVVATVAHPGLAGKNFVRMFKDTFSPKYFDRFFHDIKKDPLYDISKDSGLYIADPHNIKLTAKEEYFMNNLAQKIPILGQYIKGSERAYIGYLNRMRWDMFKQFSELYESQGKTFENRPDLYKATANLINNQTGRGKLGALENSAPVLSTFLFAPRLIASRINTLTNWLNPNFYRKVPKEVRVQYFKDMAKFIGAGLTVIGLAKLGGAVVEDDPRSSDFGKIKIGNTRWDIWGGHQQYIRMVTQIFLGVSKSAQTGKMSSLSGDDIFGTSRADVLERFVRGKLAPMPALLWDLLSGKTIIGEDVTLSKELENKLLPLLYSDIKDAAQDGGVKNALGVGIPAVFGVSVQTYGGRDYTQKVMDGRKEKLEKEATLNKEEEKKKQEQNKIERALGEEQLKKQCSEYGIEYIPRTKQQVSIKTTSKLGGIKSKNKRKGKI